MTDYILQEEDDMQQTIRQLVLKETAIVINTMISKVEQARPQITDQYTEGVFDGLSWAARILRKDKSAY
jgi:hypothetical protein